MAKKELFPVKDILLKRRGDLYDNLAGYVRKSGVCYPISSAYVVKEVGGWVDSFEGTIMEYYNALPFNYSEAYGMSRTMSVSFTFSYINFSSYSYEIMPGWIWEEEDAFGLAFQFVNEEGENSLYGGRWDDYKPYGHPDLEAYEQANGGGKGVVITAGTPYQFGWYRADGFTPDANQPVNYNASDCRAVVNLSNSHTLSAPIGRDEFCYMGACFVGERIPIEHRSKDMVCWIYEMEYDTGVWQYKFDPYDGTPANDTLFLPGQSGSRRISNKWKRAPWDRYPNL
jgi:hypothetical protein